MDSFFAHIEKHYKQQLPFVTYRKPNTEIVKVLLQQNAHIYYVKDYKESGFVFAPFNANESSILIPLEYCKLMDYKFSPDSQKGHLEAIKNSTVGLEAHIDLVSKGLSEIKEAKLKKVVLSRVQEVQGIFDPISIFKELLIRYTNAMVYCFYHPKVGLWLGATPETFLRVEGAVLKTDSLAGTQTYNPELDINWTDKELHEQQLVTDFIVEALRDKTNFIEVSNTETVKAGNLLHLRTTIEAKFTQRNIDLKNVISALHPTPAVCGLPKEKAKVFILANENYDRSYYTGFLGELNYTSTKTRNSNRRNVENNAYRSVKKRSELFVNLRCMQLKNNHALIYVGGGITSDSNPELEWQETVNKAQTMLSVLY